MGRRRGGKRKAWRRHPSGQLAAGTKPDDRVRASRQPHRRMLKGDDRLSEKAESPIGQLNLRGVIGDELYDAAIRYAGIVGAYRAVIEGPRGTAGSGRGAGCIIEQFGFENACKEDPDGCRCLKRREQYDSAYRAVFGAGQRAAKAVARVAVHREEIAREDLVYLVLGLKALAQHFGLTGRRPPPHYE